MGGLMHQLHTRQRQKVEHQEHQPQTWIPVQQCQDDKGLKVTHRMFWLWCFLLYVVTNFMSYWRSTPSWAVATIMSVGKLIFALTVGGVIIQCSHGRGGILNTLLSVRPFLFLNKFCFSIYMLAPVIVTLMFGLRNEATNFTEVGSGADFFSTIVLAILSAMILFMLVELPMQRIAKMLLKRKRLH